MHTRKGFPLQIEGVSRRVSKGFQGFPDKIKCTCKTSKVGAAFVTIRKSRVLQTEFDTGNASHKGALATAEGFPSVPAAPLYITRRGIHVERGVRMYRARAHT